MLLFCRSLIIFIFVFNAVACNSQTRIPTFPVSGKVLVNGKPAPDLFVYFHPTPKKNDQSFTPYAQTDENGDFKLNTFTSGDGVPAGDFLVVFEWREKSGTFKNQFNGPDRLEGKYSKPETSTFKVTITNQSTTLDPFELKTK